MACTGIYVLDPRCQLGSVVGNVANDVFTKIAQYFGTAAGNAIDWLWQQIGEATAVDLGSAGISRDLIATSGIAIVLCTGLFVVQVITAALRREPGGLVRAVRGLAIATLASAFAIATTKLVLAAVDELSAGLVQFTTGTSIDGLGSRFAIAASLTQITNPAGMLLFSLVLIAAVVIVWAAMMMRKLLIIVAAVLTPLAFAGGAADITRSWVRRWIEFTAALIASKLILVVMLVIGLSVFEGAGMVRGSSGSVAPPQAGTQLAAGCVLLLLAGLAPWIAIKMFHFAGESLHAVHAQSHAARSGTQAVVAAPRKVSSAASVGRGVAAAMPASTSRTTSASPQRTVALAPNRDRPGTATAGAGVVPTSVAAAATVRPTAEAPSNGAGTQSVRPARHRSPEGAGS